MTIKEEAIATAKVKLVMAEEEVKKGDGHHPTEVWEYIMKCIESYEDVDREEERQEECCF